MEKLATAEIEKRIYEMMIIIFECKRTSLVDVYEMAERIAVDCFGVEAESEQAYYIAAKVAEKYTTTHGQPKV